MLALTNIIRLLITSCALVVALSYAAPVLALQTAPENTRPDIIYVGSIYYPPLEYIDNKGMPNGFINDIQHAMAATDGSTIEVRLMQWESALTAVLDGDADAVALIPSSLRAEFFDFTQPFHYVAHGIFSSKNETQFTTLEQLSGRTVAVVRGAFAENGVKKEAPDINLVYAENELQCLALVAEHRVDACIETTITSNRLIKENNLHVKLTSPPFWPQPYAFAVKKGNTELLEQLNRQFGETIVNGDYQDIYATWARKLHFSDYSLWDYVRQLAWLLGSLIIVGGVATFWSICLRKQVAIKTLKLQQELKNSQILQEKISYAATYDHTTGLLIRRAFFEVVEHATNRPDANNKIGVIAVFIANLEATITTLGYEPAIDLVKHFSQRFSKFPGKASHFGNGLFAILISEQDDVDLIIQQFNDSLPDDTDLVQPAIAIGVAMLEESVHTLNDGRTVSSELIRRAMTALAYAQKSHLLSYIYTPSAEPDALNVKLLSDFRKYGCQHFVLYYQPQFDVAKNKITSAEALIRWLHPTMGLIPPIKFISLFEQAGVINIITRWVICEAVKMIKQNCLILGDLKISVNITTRDLADKTFIEFVKAAVHNINPTQLIFELTESELFHDSGQSKGALQQLRKLGIQCAVDDFGTGYSSLSYLHELDMHEIKLDRSFIANLATNSRSYKIVSSSLSLAHALNLSVVAEGVENQETLDILKDLNCDRIQGYLIAKPMPEVDMLKMIADRSLD